MRRTKIVATMGPASDSLEMIEELINAGVNVFRFNFSHSTQDYHLANLQKVRAVAKKLNKPIAVLQDISGPKIRIGEVDGIISLTVGSGLNFYKSKEFSDPKGVTINHPSILTNLKKGDLIYLADGSIRVEVEENQGEKIVTKVLVGGDLTSKKGVNFPGANLPISPITEKDIGDIEWGVKNGVDMMAISFVKDRADIELARNYVKQFGGVTPIFTKVEKSEAIDNLDEIIAASDGIMVARGDLGVELGLSKVPVAQKKVIKAANLKGIPVITATQMLTSMINSPYPTRAEVSDIANAVLDGTDAVMLSEETTIGKYPTIAVTTLVETIEETEKIYPFFRNLDKIHLSQDAVASAANRIAQDMDIDALIVFTKSGGAARSIAKFRPSCEILASVHSEETYRRLAVVWGVHPVLIMCEHESTDKMVCEFTYEALQRGDIKETGTYVLTVGYPTGKEGSTNLIRIMKEDDIKHIQSTCDIV